MATKKKPSEHAGELSGRDPKTGIFWQVKEGGAFSAAKEGKIPRGADAYFRMAAPETKLVIVDAKSGKEISRIRKGYSWEALEGFQKKYGFKDESLAKVIGVSGRTWTRRRKEEQSLDPIASDRLFRARAIIEMAVEVFEAKENALRWLSRPQPGLANQVPLELLDTEPGCSAVQTLLAQIEFGVLP